MAGNVFLVAFGNHQSLSKASLLHVLCTNKLTIARIVDAPQNCCILFLLLIGCVQINFDKRRIKRRFFFSSFFLGFCWAAVYTHEELLASYKGHAYLVYCLVLILLVALHHVIYRFVVLPYLPCFTSTDGKKNMRGKTIKK
jgi:uncharacterized membrane protein YozB (DUF420 family)